MKKTLVLLFFIAFFSTNILAQSSPSSVIFDSINNIIRSGQTIQLNCSMPSIILTSKTFAPGATSSYVVDSIPYNLPCPYDISSNSIDYYYPSDDLWSEVIDLNYGQTSTSPLFNFSFYGQNNLNKCAIAGNSAISWDTLVASKANFDSANYCIWRFQDVLPIPNPNFYKNCIFGPYHDIDVNALQRIGQMYFGIIGAYPERKFVVSFENMPMYQCNDLRAYHMIVLYETTNVIEFYMQSKPICYSWNDGKAILGMQNADGTQATVVSNYNLPNQWSATNEAWRIRPSGELNHFTQWYKRSVLGGDRVMLNTVNGNIVACPDSIEGPQYYIMETSIVRLDGDTILISDSCIVNPQTSLANSQYGTNIVASICNGETYSLNGFNENTTGTYTRVLQTENGCDSTVVLNLIVDSLLLPTDLLLNFYSNYVELSWQGNGDNYTIYRDGDSIANVTQRIYQDTNIIEGTYYCYRVKALNTICESDLSNQICELVGLENIIYNDNSINLFPNPTNDKVYIEIDGLRNDIDVIIHDINGKIIKPFKLIAGEKKLEIDVKGFASGVYNVKFVNKELSVTKKIIVR